MGEFPLMFGPPGTFVVTFAHDIWFAILPQDKIFIFRRLDGNVCFNLLLPYPILFFYNTDWNQLWHYYFQGSTYICI